MEEIKKCGLSDHDLSTGSELTQKDELDKVVRRTMRLGFNRRRPSGEKIIRRGGLTNHGRNDRRIAWSIST